MKPKYALLAAGLLLCGILSLNASEDLLIYSARSGNLNNVKKYLAEGLSQDTADKTGRSLMMVAAAYGRMNVVDYLLLMGADANRADNKGNTLLHLLAANRSAAALKTMQEAIRKGANLYVKNYDGRSPAVQAINAGNANGFKALLEGGYNKNEREQNMPVVMYAYSKWQRPIVKMLMESGAILSESNAAGETVLHQAALRNDATSGAEFLQTDRNIIDQKTREGKTPLICAVEKGNAPFAALLLKQGANTRIADRTGRTVLHYAAAIFNAERLLKDLPETGVDMNAKDHQGQSPIIVAAEKGRWENVAFFAKRRADLNAADSSGRTPLLIAAKKAGHPTVKLLIEAGADVKRADGEGMTLLHYLASSRGAMASQLIPVAVAKGAEVNAKSGNGATPAGTAVTSGNPQALKLLLEAGADKDGMENGRTPLAMFAYEKRQWGMAKTIIEAGADVNRQSEEGRTILFPVVMANDTTFAGFLFGRNARIDIKDNSGRTPLMAAIDKSALRTAGLLIEKGADVNLADGEGRSVLHYLAAARNASSLLGKIQWDREKVRIDAKDNAGRTPLAVATAANRADAVDYLLKNGADPNGADENGEKLIFTAYRGGRSLLNLFVDRGASTDARASDGKTLLLMGLEKYDTPLLKMLTERGANVNERQANDRYPLEFAIEKGQTQNVRLLLDAKASIEVKDRNDNPLLTLAIGKRSDEIVRMLLDRGADAKGKGTDGKSHLLHAFNENAAGIFKQLLDKGADQNVKDDKGTPVLCAAAEKNSNTFVRYLLDGGADVNAADSNSHTPLIMAAWRGSYNPAKLLLEKGADVNRKDEAGDTALFKALETSWAAKPIIDLLVKYGADVKAQGGAGDSLLHRSIDKRRFDLFDHLLKLGADPNVKNKRDETLLMGLAHVDPPAGKGSTLAKQMAQQKESLRLIESLLKGGADPNLMSRYGQSALNLARVKRNFAIVEALVGGGAKVDLQDKNGNTALKKEVMDYIGNYRMMDSLKEASRKMIDLLVAGGADINVKDRFGRTALTHTVREINAKNEKKVLDIVPYLIAKGAKTDIKDNEGFSAADYVQKSGNQQLMELVR
ncbi:MAG: ankyrin repeat domain-containing protein [Spirochaetes bacterium]|nr:ankyrin repeat domain-containing protein [Spirochaetota bacterium]